MDEKEILESLHPLERKILAVLKDNDKAEDVAHKAGLQTLEALRAFQWLQNKHLVTVHEEIKEEVSLGANGKEYSKKGLPETRLLSVLSEKLMPVSTLLEKAYLTMEELHAALGVLKRRNAVTITKKEELLLAITPEGIKLRTTESPEEKLLKKAFPLALSQLTADERVLVEQLQKRKDVLFVHFVKTKRAVFTPEGKKITAKGIAVDTIDRVTTELLTTKAWKNKHFRRFDVTSPVPRKYGGKKHHYRTFLDSVRAKFLALGFTEMDGPIVETDFWNMDALFMPQFHSARDIHDAYYVKEPKYSDLDPKLVEKVRQAHENGYGTGSKGWQYSFDTKRTHRCLLRTQGTACSSRMLASPALKIPGKYFGITRVFRADVIDATHNVDFYQTEGIVIEEGLTLRHLFGLLKLFAQEFAKTTEIKIVPGYFPFTEPSCELYAKHPDLGWVELGGAGIFRPELVKPLLGKEISVLAWGIGIDRIGMFNLGLKDIRALFSHDLSFLRTARMG